MLTVILVIHLMLALALTGVILVQKSEGGALGMGGGGMGGFMSGRSAANLLTRTTAILAACFFLTSIALALIATHQRAPSSIINSGAPPGSTSPAPSGPLAPTPSTAPQLPGGAAPPAPASNAPAAPGTPAAPLAK